MLDSGRHLSDSLVVISLDQDLESLGKLEPIGIGTGVRIKREDSGWSNEGRTEMGPD